MGFPITEIEQRIIQVGMSVAPWHLIASKGLRPPQVLAVGESAIEPVEGDGEFTVHSGSDREMGAQHTLSATAATLRESTTGRDSIQAINVAASQFCGIQLADVVFAERRQR